MGKLNISFEVFPPKKDGDFSAAFEIIKQLKDLSPEFISVTYGAGGSQSKKTLEIASFIQNELNIEAVPHLTCVGSSKNDIFKQCTEFKKHNINSILALRGDRPKTMTDEQYENREFTYATDLIEFINDNFDFELSAACYPEKHFESPSFESDLKYMKMKQDMGVSSFISQLFFDNECFYDFKEKIGGFGITAPIHVGIMPITTAKQIGTTVSLSGSSVPKKLTDIIAKYGDNHNDMYKAGIEYAIEQINGLIQNGVQYIHIYTMNKPDIAKAILDGIK